MTTELALNRVFVIAEAGSNWRVGSPSRDRAMGRALIAVARDAGADAVKFQTFRSATTYAPQAGQAAYLEATGERASINELFEDLEMPDELIPELATACAAAGIEFMSSTFSVDDVRKVDPHVARHKVASYEISHVPLLRALSHTRKPVIVSTGAATRTDIRFALGTLRAAGASDITLLQCTASYPAPPNSLNLRVLPALRREFRTPVGLSDHSRDPLVAPLMAVALGASVIEKHFTLDRRLPGPDHQFALTPAELSEMVRTIRLAEQALGDDRKAVSAAETELRSFAVRAIHALQDIAEGEPLRLGANIDVLRPGRRLRGLHPRHLDALEGRQAARPIRAGDGIVPEDVVGFTPEDDHDDPDTLGSRGAPSSTPIT